MTFPRFATIAEMRSALASKTISAVELAREHLDRIAASDLNSFVTVCEDDAVATAREADGHIGRHGQSGLVGVPVAHKDVFCTAGVRTTCASRMLAGFVPPYDATVVARFRDSGAIMLGKTNMDEFAMGSSNENSHFGSVSNPWDVTRVPGGSSGGSAAAVAAGLVPAATATDTGGSIRQPAAFCGISGLKPTYGRVSRYGMVAFASSLDQGGPMARSAEDLRLLLQHMEGHDPLDSTSADIGPTPREADRVGLRIGVVREYGRDLDARLAATVDEAAAVFERLGHERVEISLPHTTYATAAYYVVASAEASTNLSRYDGVRYGHRAESPNDLDDLYARSRSEGFGAEVKRRILTGTYALSIGYYDAYYRKAQRLRRLIRQDFLDAFRSVEAILAPATPSTAFEKGALLAPDETKDPTVMYEQDVYTVPASLAGLPALSIPCGIIDGLPVGMQLIGPHFGEDRLLALAESFQQETDWHQRTPPR
ncbi:MAG: Asp-tRNA(Asn)/Glu-tRNA(Gln) amidotransferase subunit GatA [Gammaproteobacteria bacterium]|nr:Asp-tRNA(Asn)/Glu-tRNA(Gln) amidotransferase subunit GatA [Gammaproteobacteria bacterium]MYF30870.1 Asp-tRNA(Asn)/Glu-tRNA(Gln) amidotransferase subunit GatA [Gammaproteobacteria bacterium]MYK46493.1 Asp-tRNA(Asn)/Glu-tRNA(Gln) amidotransferase subunit GatA [Gammaproteobacteria bacterium]